MIRVSRVFAFTLTAWAAVCLFGTPAVSSGTVDPLTDLPTKAPGGADTADELQDVLRELRELRRGYYAKRDLLEEQVRGAREQVTRLQQDVTELDQERAKLSDDEASMRSELDELAAEGESLQADHDRALAVLTAAGGRLRELVQGGIPYRLSDRLADVDALEAAGSAREAFVQLWTFCEEELRVARSGETYSDSIDLGDGRTKDVRFVRVGRSVLGFVSEDGLDVGLWVGGKGWSTGSELADPEAVRAAVEILDRRRGPEHVVLPLQLSPRAR